MTIELKPEETQIIDQAIQAGLIQRPDEIVGMAVKTLSSRLEALRSRVEQNQATASRYEAVRRMQEFGKTHGLSLGEPITRKLMHDGHRY